MIAATIGPREMPEWAAEAGFYVWHCASDGLYVAAHMDPKHGDHACSFAAYATEAEAIVRCIQEARR